MQRSKSEKENLFFFFFDGGCRGAGSVCAGVLCEHTANAAVTPLLSLLEANACSQKQLLNEATQPQPSAVS